MESVIKSLSPESHTLVLLNGLIHTDDNLALKSIIQQLQMENLDGTFAQGSYAGLYILLKIHFSIPFTKIKHLFFLMYLLDFSAK